MSIAQGDRVPDVGVHVMGPDGPQPVRTGELLGTGKVVLFAVPGAFTPTCSDHHLPGFVVRAEDLRLKGVDQVVCVAVNDAFVMGAWGKAQRVGDTVTMVADGNAEFTKAMGLEFDGSAVGLGQRSQRYAAIIDDGVITSIFVEPARALDVSSVESVLAAL